MDFYNLLQDLRIDSTDTLRRFGNQQSILERFLLKFLDDSTMLALKDAFSCRDKDGFESHAHTLQDEYTRIIKILEDYKNNN